MCARARAHFCKLLLKLHNNKAFQTFTEAHKGATFGLSVGLAGLVGGREERNASATPASVVLDLWVHVLE